MKKTLLAIKNSVHSDMSNFLSEFKSGELDTESFLAYCANILLSADVDSDVVIDVLESPTFGQEGKDIARNIKVVYGY